MITKIIRKSAVGGEEETSRDSNNNKEAQEEEDAEEEQAEQVEGRRRRNMREDEQHREDEKTRPHEHDKKNTPTSLGLPGGSRGVVGDLRVDCGGSWELSRGLGIWSICLRGGSRGILTRSWGALGRFWVILTHVGPPGPLLKALLRPIMGGGGARWGPSVFRTCMSKRRTADIRFSLSS